MTEICQCIHSRRDTALAAQSLLDMGTSAQDCTNRVWMLEGRKLTPQPALAIWTLDRLIRFVLTIWINRSHLRTGGAVVDDCSVEVVSKDVLRVTIVRPGLKWAAGQHL